MTKKSTKTSGRNVEGGASRRADEVAANARADARAAIIDAAVRCMSVRGTSPDSLTAKAGFLVMMAATQIHHEDAEMLDAMREALLETAARVRWQRAKEREKPSGAKPSRRAAGKVVNLRAWREARNGCATEA